MYNVLLCKVIVYSDTVVAFFVIGVIFLIATFTMIIKKGKT